MRLEPLRARSRGAAERGNRLFAILRLLVPARYEAFTFPSLEEVNPSQLLVRLGVAGLGRLPQRLDGGTGPEEPPEHAASGLDEPRVRGTLEQPERVLRLEPSGSQQCQGANSLGVGRLFADRAQGLIDRARGEERHRQLGPGPTIASRRLLEKGPRPLRVAGQHRFLRQVDGRLGSDHRSGAQSRPQNHHHFTLALAGSLGWRSGRRQRAAVTPECG